MSKFYLILAIYFKSQQLLEKIRNFVFPKNTTAYSIELLIISETN